MRFMMLMYPGPDAYKKAVPELKDVEQMMKYNEELTKAGVLLALDGLQGPDKGVRVRYAGGKAKVTDGPFAEAKELVGGYWMLQVKSKEEAVEWARRVPAGPEDMVELRQVFEASDFAVDAQSEVAAAMDRVGEAVGYKKEGK